MKSESKNLFTEKPICIVGTGGCARDIYCCLADVFQVHNVEIKGRVVFSDVDSCPLSYVNMGDGQDVEVVKESQLNFDKYAFIIGVGDPKVREIIVNKYPLDICYATVIHPSAIISDHAEIGEGSVIAAGCIITCNVRMGKHTQLNLRTNITHDCNAGDYFTTALSVNVCGNCTIGNRVYLGTNASLRQGTSICDDVTVGMGGVVLNNITEPGVYVGVPVRKM